MQITIYIMLKISIVMKIPWPPSMLYLKLSTRCIFLTSIILNSQLLSICKACRIHFAARTKGWTRDGSITAIILYILSPVWPNLLGGNPEFRLWPIGRDKNFWDIFAAFWCSRDEQGKGDRKMKRKLKKIRLSGLYWEGYILYRSLCEMCSNFKCHPFFFCLISFQSCTLYK